MRSGMAKIRAFCIRSKYFVAATVFVFIENEEVQSSIQCIVRGHVSLIGVVMGGTCRVFI